MPKEFQLSVVAPDREVFNETAVSAVLPGEAGWIGALAGHEPYVVALKAGTMSFVGEGARRRQASIGGGFAEITQTRITILADSAQLIE